MLKWLKQKPVNGHDEVLHGTTDDPLATIQVHPVTTTTKISSKRNTSGNPTEIYAVSRVNPLFEDETGKGALSPGNQSGSSGYDSGPSDDEIPTGNILNTLTSSDGHSANPVVEIIMTNDSHPLQIFSNQDDLLIHHEATIVDYSNSSHTTITTSPPSQSHQPILNVINQNSKFVKSIVVAVEPPHTGGFLIPLAESSSTNNKYSAISNPMRSGDDQLAKKPGDKLGAAKLIQRSSNYVQGIRILPSNVEIVATFGKSNVNHHSSNSSVSLVRKQSVTFAEKVEVVDRKVIPLSRRHSSGIDQDSIVTDSLLLMTTTCSHQLHDSKYGKHGSKLTTCKFQQHQLLEDQDDSNLPIDNSNLTTFSNSLSKNRIVKQIISKNPSSLIGSDESEKNEDEFVEPEYEQNNHSQLLRRPRSITTGSKSSFGGIADHYAAAKEIAKEIESYSTGTTKSTKISLVKDLLLSSRGRGGAGLTPPSSTNRKLHGRHDDDDGGEMVKVDGQNSTLLKTLLHLNNQSPLVSSSSKHKELLYEDSKRIVDHPWETVRVEVQRQVYVKANDKNLTTTSWSHLSKRTPSDGHLHQHHHHHHQPNIYNSKSQPQLTRNYKYTTKSHVGTHYHQNEGQDQFYRRLSDPSEISSDSGGGGPPTPDRIPIYEALPPGAASLHYHPQDDSDSGNSTDRALWYTSSSVQSPKDDHHQSGDETKILKFSSIPTTEVKPENNLKGCNQKGCSQNTGGTSTCGSNNEKVMIVSGDSQNLVVDLSGVPPDLRDAIISGTALVTLPDGLNQRLDPGYTVVTVPQGHEYEVLPSSKNHTYLGKSKESVDFATKNLTQVWEVMQHKGKGKRITTILPYHPNQDSHTTADFTIEGQPQARQTKRVKRQKTRRCLCRICGIFVFLGAFLGVIVTLSLFYTNGKHYFGPV